MSKRVATIADFMTPTPHSVGLNQTLAVAHAMMQKHQGRHLPVLEGGKLVGIVTQRDLYLIETFKDVDPNTVPVEDAMTMDVYCVEAEDTLKSVVAHMSSQKIGCAVIMDRTKVVGLFTTTDAMNALVKMLD
jgi:acetoin utilization protein AcuB